MSVMQRSQLTRYVLQAAGEPLAAIDAASRSIGDFYFQNVPLPLASGEALSCPVTARRQAVMSMEQF